MKIFAINETEWIAANSEAEAIKFSGLESEEIKNIEEIPESQWDEEIECEDPDNEDATIPVKIRDLMAPAIENNEPMCIVTENN